MRSRSARLATRSVAIGVPRRPETVTEARARLAACAPDELDALIRRLSRDPRAGVRQAAAIAKGRLDRLRREQQRLDGLMLRQAELHRLGVRAVAGIDEVGRGALAGPVTACAVVLAVDCRIEGLDDSKRLAPDVRSRVADLVRTQALAYSLGHASPEEIDRHGIGHATRLAWQRALDGLSVEVGHVLVDGNDPGALGVPTTAVVRGDSSVACIAAASVVAKVERDRLMTCLGKDYPAYGFEANRGYGTSEHIAAIGRFGPSAVHRRSFAPCAEQPSLF
jgi:ribonuclease HII